MQVTADSPQEEVSEWLWEIVAENLVPPAPLTVSEWADNYRLLSSKAAAEPGPWRTDRTPYLRDIMDALSENNLFQWVVFMKGAQIGGTECGLNWIGYIIDHAPAPTMIVWPTEANVKTNVRIRIEPLIDSTPCLGEKIGDAGDKEGANNTTLKEFPGGFLAIAGSNSSADLRSIPIKDLLLDEVDEYPKDANGQGDPIGLAEARTRTFGVRRKIFLVSTPTIEGESTIEEAYEATDMQRYYVPCPLCGVFQVLAWGQMRYDKGRPDLAWYECPHCSGRIENHHKSVMLPAGEWRPEKESSDPTRIGFHLSALYSPVGMLTWGQCMIAYLQALTNPQKMKVFVNTILGETYAEKSERPDWEKLYYRREDYGMGTVPEGVLLITAGIDVQKDRVEVEVVGWGRDKESWSIEYLTFIGETEKFDSEVWTALNRLMLAGYVHPSGVVMHIASAAIDSGYNTSQVYNWARLYQSPRVIVVKGEDSLVQAYTRPTAVDVILSSGRRVRRGLKLFRIGVSFLKAELYACLGLARPEGGAPTAGFCHFPSYDEEYFKQLTAEHYHVKKTKSLRKPRGEWKKDRERNEALDCRIYARAAAAVLGIDTLKPDDWDKLELSFGSIRRAPSAEPEAGASAGPVARPKRGRGMRSKGI